MRFIVYGLVSLFVGRLLPFTFPSFSFMLSGMDARPNLRSSGDSHILPSQMVVSLRALFERSVFKHCTVSGSRHIVSTCENFVESVAFSCFEAICRSMFRLS